MLTIFSQNSNFFDLKGILGKTSVLQISRGVVHGGDRSAMAPPDFGRSVNPISTRRRRLCPPNNTGTPGFSDLPTYGPAS